MFLSLVGLLLSLTIYCNTEFGSIMSLIFAPILFSSALYVLWRDGPNSLLHTHRAQYHTIAQEGVVVKTEIECYPERERCNLIIYTKDAQNYIRHHIIKNLELQIISGLPECIIDIDSGIVRIPF